jgi:hypothetical protein
VTTQPPFNILYSGNAERDKESLLAYLDEFGAVHGVQPFEVDDHAIGRTLSNMLVPPWPSGIVQASPFKKVASFVCSFVYEKPIVTRLPVNSFGNLHDHQNAIAAHQIAADALHNAIIECPYRGKIVLGTRISVSRHFWKELIATLHVATPAHFNLVSLIYESLTYEANPEASYKNVMAQAIPSTVIR